eukprot:scaffold2381_cov196-Skeletonema_dohrnii-CCMP3373.AAC.6
MHHGRNITTVVSLPTMIFQIVLAIAAAVAPTAECYSMNPAHQYVDMIGRMNLQEANHPVSNPNQHPPTIDAQIIEKNTSEEQAAKAPPLPQTNNPFALLGLSVAASFDAVRQAYKEKVKVYHPDVLVGPDASQEERKQANWDFARINSAYDILKRREDEEVYEYEYEMYVDGEQVTRTMYVDKDQRQYRRDAHYVDYDRIRQVAEYRNAHPRKKMWYEEDHEYQSINNGFERGASYCSNQKWYNHLEMFEYEQEMGCPPYNGFVSNQERRNGFGGGHQHGQVEEKFWHNRHTFETPNHGNAWYEDNSPNTGFDGEEENSYDTYNDRWYRTAAEHEFGTSNSNDDYEYDHYDPTDTWHKQFNDNEPRFNGHFGP